MKLNVLLAKLEQGASQFKALLVGTWHHPQGILIDLLAEWRFLGLHNTFYKGGSQMPLYPQLGAQLNQGCLLYTSKRPWSSFEKKDFR